jgi:glycosyltransferase involved in cell wall biosynthesis
MDLCAEMLLRHLKAEHAYEADATRICPPFRRRAGRVPVLGRRRWASNVDRLLNRFWDYPRHLRKHGGTFDFFHLCDHSYAQLVHVLPAARTGVFCHDLDAFRCLLEPDREPRPRWFKALARRILAGCQKAAVVFYSTDEVRRQIERFALFDPRRLVHAPYGIAVEFTPGSADGRDPEPQLAGLGIRSPFLLHVGSCIPRKRIDVLLEVLAGVKGRHPEYMLVQVGGRWTAAQREQIERLGLQPAVVQLRGLERDAVAALYQRAALVLQPSEAEGFGLPVIEALACGGIVVASDLPTLCEVGGAAVVYRPVGDVPRWVETACALLEAPQAAPDRETRLAQARRFSWSAHTRTVLEAYRRLC